MNKHLVALIFGVLVLNGCTQAPRPSRPHLDPEASAQEIEKMLSEDPEIENQAAVVDARRELKEITDSGLRLYAWLEVINKARPADQKISFTSKATQKAYPIENPRPYNVASIKSDYAKRIAASPADLLAVLQDKSKPLPSVVPTSDEIFRSWGLEITSSYDLATRWIGMVGYINDLKTEQVGDVRGYYFLSQMADRDAKLNGFASLDAAAQTNIREWLGHMCLNNQSWDRVDVAACKAEVSAAESRKTLLSYYNSKLSEAKNVFDANFALRWPRRDITWKTTDAGVAHYPFLTPSNPALLAFLRDNIEDEFKTATWQLRLDFVATSKGGTSRLESQPGVTPHAIPSESKIVMDENEPITEYGSQWMIRHEFGHLIGFPDCYVEFYDESVSAIMYYQIDATNLMCSRRGVFQPQHFEKLKAAYLR